MRRASTKRLLFASGLALSFSLIAELYFRFTPCHLCQVQRGIHFLLIASSLASLILSKRYGLQQWIHRGCLIVLTSSTILASYHTLIQLGLAKDRCKQQVKISDVSSYQALMLNPLKKGCSESGWKLGKIPISALNAGLSLCLLLDSLPFPRKILFLKTASKNK